VHPQVGVQSTLNDRKQILFTRPFVGRNAPIQPSHGPTNYQSQTRNLSVFLFIYLYIYFIY